MLHTIARTSPSRPGRAAPRRAGRATLILLLTLTLALPGAAHATTAPHGGARVVAGGDDAGRGTPRARAARAPVFTASLYGVQRFKAESSWDAPPDPYCWDDFGSNWAESKITFSSVRPVRVRLSRGRGMPVNAGTNTRTGANVDLKASFEAMGDEVAQTWDCSPEQRGWVMAPSPDVNVCAKTELVGMGLFFTHRRAGRITVTGGQEAPPAEPQALDCPWGDVSFVLYEAHARFDAGPLLDGEAKEMQVILRGREVDRQADHRSRAQQERTTTVYLTIKRKG